MRTLVGLLVLLAILFVSAVVGSYFFPNEHIVTQVGAGFTGALIAIGVLLLANTIGAMILGE